MPVNGFRHFDQSPRWSSTVLAFAEDLVFGDWKPVLLCCRAGQPRNPLPSQDFALHEVPSRSSSKDPMSPTQEFLQASLIWRLCSGSLLWAQTSSPHCKASRTLNARRARYLLGRPSRMFPRLIFSRSGKRNRSRSSFRIELSSRCLPTALVTMRSI